MFRPGLSFLALWKLARIANPRAGKFKFWPNSLLKINAHQNICAKYAACIIVPRGPFEGFGWLFTIWLLQKPKNNENWLFHNFWKIWLKRQDLNHTSIWIAKFAICYPMPTVCLSCKQPGIEPAPIAVPMTLKILNSWVKHFSYDQMFHKRQTKQKICQNLCFLGIWLNS